MKAFKLLAASALGIGTPAVAQPDPGYGRELPEGSAHLDFVVANRTGRTITEIAITPRGEGSPWSVDILAPRNLPDGERGAASYARDIELCWWAIRATFEDGRTREFPAVNLCETIRVELR